MLIRGLPLVADKDHDTLVITGRLYDSLHKYARVRLLTGREPAA